MEDITKNNFGMFSGQKCISCSHKWETKKQWGKWYCWPTTEVEDERKLRLLAAAFTVASVVDGFDKTAGVEGARYSSKCKPQNIDIHVINMARTSENEQFIFSASARFQNLRARYQPYVGPNV